MLEYIKSKIDSYSLYLSKKYLIRDSINTLAGWENHRRYNIIHNPIKYFLIEEFLGNISYIIERLIADPAYNLKSKYIKKWHHVKIDVQRFTTNENSYDTYSVSSYHYTDPINIMLDSTFQILVDFVEEEGYQHDWESNNKDAWDEINTLYIWWVKGRFEEGKKYIPPKFSDYGINMDIFKKYKLEKLPDNDKSFQQCKKFDNAHNEYIDIDDAQGTKEQDMLIRLVKIRRYLWS